MSLRAEGLVDIIDVMMNLLRRIASAPMIRRVVLRPRVRRALARVLMLRFLRAAFVTTSPLRVLTGEAFRRGQVEMFTVAATGERVALQHGRDLEALYELFVKGEYEPPRGLQARFGPRLDLVVDVGANVGMFSAWAMGRWPTATIVSFEPSPESAVVYRQWAASHPSQVDFHEAAARNHEGTMLISSGRGGGNHVVAEGGIGETVATLDLFQHVRGADFVKMDIEGGEWEILSDPRMSELANTTWVIEYHRYLAPSLPARDAAVRLFERAGFTTGYGSHNYWGHGTLWAWKE